MIEKLTLSKLEEYLSKAAWILKGPVDASDFKAYIFPMLFYKRISDVFDDEYQKIQTEEHNIIQSMEHIIRTQDFLRVNMYNHKKVVINNNKGKKILNDLFIYLLKNSKKHISNDMFKNGREERVIADFIAGMTDRYAINLHEKIK